MELHLGDDLGAVENGDAAGTSGLQRLDATGVRDVQVLSVRRIELPHHLGGRVVLGGRRRVEPFSSQMRMYLRSTAIVIGASKPPSRCTSMSNGVASAGRVTAP